MSDRIFGTARVTEPDQTLEPEIRHVAVQPSWDCHECGRLWPCESWRRAIRAEEGMSPTLLSITMAAYLQDAVGDGLPLHGLYLRFIDWTRPDLPGTGGPRLP